VKPCIVNNDADKKKWRPDCTSDCYTRRSMQDAVATTADIRPRPAPVLSEISRRELYFFNLFRVFQATVIAGLIFSPFAVDWVTLTHRKGEGAPVHESRLPWQVFDRLHRA